MIGLFIALGKDRIVVKDVDGCPHQTNVFAEILLEYVSPAARITTRQKRATHRRIDKEHRFVLQNIRRLLYRGAIATVIVVVVIGKQITDISHLRQGNVVGTGDHHKVVVLRSIAKAHEVMEIVDIRLIFFKQVIDNQRVGVAHRFCFQCLSG